MQIALQCVELSEPPYHRDMKGSFSQLNPNKIFTAAISHEVHLKIATVSASLSLPPCGLPLRCAELKRGSGERRQNSRTIVSHLSNIVYELEMKEVDWNRGVRIPYLFCNGQICMAGVIVHRVDTSDLLATD